LGWFIVLGVLLVGAYLWLFGRNELNQQESSRTLKQILVSFGQVILPVIAFAGLWYLNNWVQRGSFLYTSQMNLPNYDWAVEQLHATASTPPPVAPLSYLVSLGFMFIDPAVMGYVWLVPLLLGLVSLHQTRYHAMLWLRRFVFLEVLWGILIFAQSLYGLPFLSATYNPRDIMMLAPLLCIMSAMGIQHVVTRIARETAVDWRTLGLIGGMGLVSYVHSVLAWFTKIIRPNHVWVQLLTAFTTIFGLSLRETSFQLRPDERVEFVASNLPKLGTLGILAGLPVIGTLIGGYLYRRRSSRQSNAPQPHSSIPGKTVLAITLILVWAIIVPRVSMYQHESPQSLFAASLSATYGTLYDFLETPLIEPGRGILTYQAPDGLPYYLSNNPIIDLRWPANLGMLRDALTASSPASAVDQLQSVGIHYLLLNPSTLDTLDRSLDSAFTQVLNHPAYSTLQAKYGAWTLYVLGDTGVDETTVPLEGWVVDARYTNASYRFTSTSDALILELIPTDNDSRVTLRYDAIPNLFLTESSTVRLHLEGSANARLLLRLFIGPDASYDVVQWQAVSAVNGTQLSLFSIAGSTLRGDAYLALISEDGLPASVRFLGISIFL
jgi:hypothetical protein